MAWGSSLMLHGMSLVVVGCTLYAGLGGTVGVIPSTRACRMFQVVGVGPPLGQSFLSCDVVPPPCLSGQSFLSCDVVPSPWLSGQH